MLTHDTTSISSSTKPQSLATLVNFHCSANMHRVFLSAILLHVRRAGVQMCGEKGRLIIPLRCYWVSPLIKLSLSLQSWDKIQGT